MDARKLAILEEKKKQLNFFKDDATVEKELEVVKNCLINFLINMKMLKKEPVN